MDTYLERREGKQREGNLRGRRRGCFPRHRDRCPARAFLEGGAARHLVRGRCRHCAKKTATILAESGFVVHLQVTVRRSREPHLRQVEPPVVPGYRRCAPTLSGAGPAVFEVWQMWKSTRRARASRESRARSSAHSRKKAYPVPATKVIVNIPGERPYDVRIGADVLDGMGNYRAPHRRHGERAAHPSHLRRQRGSAVSRGGEGVASRSGLPRERDRRPRRRENEVCSRSQVRFGKRWRRLKLGRDCAVVALGGGVVGDLGRIHRIHVYARHHRGAGADVAARHG